MIKHFVAPCATKLRSQKEVVRFLDPSLKPVRYTKAKKLAMALDQIPLRDELHPEDWKATRDIDPSIFARYTQTGSDIKDANLEETVKEKPELEK